MSTPIAPRNPRRGEIWFVHLATDPPEKGKRPVLIVSTDARNAHPKADSVLVVPISTSITKDAPTHLYLAPGETGLEPSVARAEDVTVVQKDSLEPARGRLRNISNARICQLAEMVRIAMDCHRREGQG